jgi:putative ABC transport system permease protein
MALAALWANKLRSFLTLLGIIIGVSSVIAVMSLVQGLDRYVSTQLASAGVNVFNVDKVGIEFDLEKMRVKLRRKDLRPEDAAAIARAARHVEAVAAERTAVSRIERGNRSLRQVAVRGVEPDYMLVNDLPVAQGRPIGGIDLSTRAPVCVLGSDVAEHLFEHRDPLGAEVRLGPHRLVVVGVGKELGSAFGASRDSYVLLPLTSFERRFGRLGSVTIGVRSRGAETFAQAQDEARAILRARRHLAPAAPDDFEIVTPEMYMSLWRNLSGAISIVIVGVSMISLVVGGIVIMNIMLVSVTERTREIGLRKAVGATRRDVLAQFLVEAITLSLAGGAVGLGLGVGAAVLIGLVTPLPVYVSPLAVALGLIVSTAVGLFFGAYPAARAARLDPVVALRRE